MAIPGFSLTITVIGLYTIALGNGLFKGNLQAVVGQLYDDPKYSSLRDSAFLIFYMGINVGAFFAPFAATAMRNWLLHTNGFLHDASLPAQCHQFLNGTLKNVDAFTALAQKVSLTGPVSDLHQFAERYLEVFSRGYNYAFGIAAGAMIISLLVYLFYQGMLPGAYKQDKASKATDREKVQMPWSEEKPRLIALILVFIVVIFFWMSFHQNGLTLTFFARDYIVKQVGPFTYLFFTLPSLLSVVGTIAGIVLLVGKNRNRTSRMIGGAMLVIFGALTTYFVITNGEKNDISPEVFQTFNPLFIVSLSFVVLALFEWQRKRGTEPSTPKKIGIGMILAAVGFFIVLLSSLNLISPHTLQGQPVPDASRVSPYWLVSTYLVLTIAELFLSPMGLSFVSKVAPPRFQGLMQGGWLGAAALGNILLRVGSYFWGKLELWQLWSIFIVCCLLSAMFMFSMLKRLEQVAK
jgi:POT family proton-dependent oligopeptide transporter